MAGLLLVFAVTLADSSQTASGAGQWFKLHLGPDVVIILIFFFSGLILNARQIRTGILDFEGLVIALALIFLVSPLAAALFGLMPLDTSIKLGIFLVAVMPSTLSSGVVMTGASGGNMAHALVITVLANALAVLTIPVALSLLLNLIDGTAIITIDKPAMMIKIGRIVVLPLCLGLLTKLYFKSFTDRLGERLQKLNQVLVLFIVWMALSQAKVAIITGGAKIGVILIMVFVFHGILLATAGVFTTIFKLGKGRRESVIFMGGQKTLPLSIILQVSLFPQYGLALVVCVMHHLIHLLMDGYLMERLKGG